MTQLLKTPAKRSTVFAKSGLAMLAALLVFWSCRINNSEGDTKFNLVPDSAWADCDSLLVELLDASGEVLDTLFDDSLRSLDQLNGLDASKYPGGSAQVHIRAWNADGSVCAEQSRTFEDEGGNVVVDTVRLPAAQPSSVALDADTLDLKAGDPGAEIKASLEPKFADQIFEWSVEDPSIATLDLPNGPNSKSALVIPLKNGLTRVKAKAKRDTSVSAEVVVRVGPPSGRSIVLLPDSLTLYLGGPDSAFQTSTAPEAGDGDIEWSSSDKDVAKVDADGKVHGVKEGSAVIEAKYGDAADSASVQVKRDVPSLTVANKSGAAVNTPIVFSPKATQEFGSIVMFKFDLDGDGSWDDSLPGPFLGTAVDLPSQSAAFAKEGEFKVRFLVRDSEGNEATAEVTVDIGNQPPEVVAKSGDTLVSIDDLVPLLAKVRDAEGKVALVGWDYDGDGKLDDSVKADDSEAVIKGGRKYSKPGRHVATLYATDDAGKTGVDSVIVLVVLDPPTADMGPDISVIAGSPVAFSVKGTDKFGTIAKREIRIGSGSFINLGKQDTSIVVPGDSGKVQVIGRVTDDDDNPAEDTMVVTLLPPSKSNNDLASLVPSAGVLTPGFKPVTVAYSLSVGYADSLVAVTALTVDPEATLLVNGKPATSGKPSDSIAVSVGTTLHAVEIVVTAQDGTQKIYSVAITRAPSADAGLSKLEPSGFALKPAFQSNVFDYSDTVAFKVGSVSLKPTASHPDAKITVNDSAVNSGSASGSLDLDVGDNLIKIAVTAQDGKTKSAYTIKLVRRAKVLVSRAIGTDTARVDSLEAPLGAVVSLKVPDSAGYHFTKWALIEGTGTFQDSTANPAKLTVKAATVRATGVQEINEYTITGTISGFVGGAYDHETVKVKHGKDTSITVTPLVGYRILSVTDGGNALNALGSANKFGPKTYKLTNVTANHTLVATFLKTYTLAASVSGSGTVSPNGTTEVDSGSTQTFTLTSGSPSTGVWVSAFTDNGSDASGSLTGDRMNVSTYKLTGITANHTIAATFAVRTYRMIVTGHDLCINKVVSCPVGQLCPIKFCLAGSGPDADTLDVSHGASYTISTADSLGSRPFLNWNKNGASFSTSTGITTGAITSDVTFNAVYKSIIIDCCLLGTCCKDPPILLPLDSSPSSATVQPQSLESGMGAQ